MSIETPRARPDLHIERDRDACRVFDPVRERELRLETVPAAVLAAADGRRSLDAIAEIVAEELEAEVPTAGVEKCVDYLDRLFLLVDSEHRQPISFGRRLSLLASEQPDAVALVSVGRDGGERFLSWSEFDRWSNRWARGLARRGVAVGHSVAIGLPNGASHVIAVYAAWKLGALVVPLRPVQPALEREQMLALVEPAVVVANWTGVDWTVVTEDDLERCSESEGPLPDRVPHPGKAIGSGGSTGRPKIIVDPEPCVLRIDDAEALKSNGMRSGQVQLIAGPLYHNGPFVCMMEGVFAAHRLVLMEKFDAALAVALIERHRVQFTCLAPTTMKRIVELPAIERGDLSSLEAIYHTGAPCPPWLKRAWLDLIGGEKVYEGFGGAESIGGTEIRGDEWLRHPGSVGKPSDCELRILDDAQEPVPSGEIGEIYTRLRASAPSYQYLGATPLRSTPDGFVSLGDLGWLDDDGYLYIADRRVDMIVTGGENVYPAEVEAVLTEIGEVADAVVIGLPDPEWGRRVHAVIQPRNPAAPPDPHALAAHCRASLAPYKVPKNYEIVAEIPRDEAGKVRRLAMVQERISRM